MVDFTAFPISVRADAAADTNTNLSSLWLMVAAALVLVMTPGVAFFCGGMVKAKSVISVLMMSFGALGLIGVLWVAYGYSLSFGAGDDWLIPHVLLNPFANLGLSRFLSIDGDGFLATADVAGTNALAFAGFQPTFAIITVALIFGAIADRAKFGPWMVFAGF